MKQYWLPLGILMAMIAISLFPAGAMAYAPDVNYSMHLPVLMKLHVTGNPGNPQDQDAYLPGEVVLKLSQAADLAVVASDYALDPTPLDQFGTRPIFHMRIADGAAPPDRAAQLAADPRVIYAEPNFVGQTPEGRQQISWAKGGGGGEYAGQWAASMIRLPEAHTLTRGAGVTVAVLDTGVDLTHPALAGRLVSGFDFVDMDTEPGEVGSQDQNTVYGHGTHVAGLVALAAPEARIMPLRVLDPDGIGNIWVIAEALAYAVNPDGNLETDDGADVINLSLSTYRQTNLLAEIVADVTCSGDDDDDDRAGGAGSDDDDDDCLARPPGAVVVAVAGNSGSNIPEYPAAEAVAGSMSVGASTPADALASFSNHGPWVHLMAPGENVLSSVPGGEYGVWSGTSMASPLAAGVAALVRAAYPDLESSAVVQQMIATSANTGGPLPLRIDAAAALASSTGGGDSVCTSSLGPVTVENLEVPGNSTCTLNGTRVQGNIKVQSGATLNASGIHVIGNVQAEGAASVNLDSSTVGGSVQIVQGGSSQLFSSIIDGDVQYFKNTGSIAISNNTIDGNLQCKENNPAPTGGGNTVHGNKEDQCSNL